VGFASSHLGARRVAIAVFLSCGALRAAIAILGECRRNLSAMHGWAPVFVDILQLLQAILLVILGAASESQWVLMNALVQNALHASSATLRTSGNATYRLVNSAASVAMPVVTTQAMKILDARQVAYSPLVIGCAAVSLGGAACLRRISPGPREKSPTGQPAEAQERGRFSPQGAVQDLIAAYRPVFQCPTLVWLSVVVCMQTALDVVINVYAPQKFMDELGMTPQGYGAVMSICSIAGLAAISVSGALLARTGVKAFAVSMLSVQALACMGLTIPSTMHTQVSMTTCLLLHRAAGISMAVPSSIWTASVSSLQARKQGLHLDLGTVYALQKVIGAAEKIIVITLAGILVRESAIGRKYSCFFACTLCYPALAWLLVRLPSEDARARQVSNLAKSTIKDN